jgi:hypothetical protein
MHRVHWVDPDWKTTWGLGFSVQRDGERTLVRHGGACPGYYTEFALEPKSKLAVIVLSNAIGAEVGFYARQAFELIGPAVASALDDPQGAPAREASLDSYVGVYESAWGQAAIVRWQDGLAELWLSTRSPSDALTKLRRVGEPADHTFRRVRDDDGSLGETYLFEVDDEGRATRFKQHSNWMVRLK